MLFALPTVAQSADKEVPTRASLSLYGGMVYVTSAGSYYIFRQRVKQIGLALDDPLGFAPAHKALIYCSKAKDCILFLPSLYVEEVEEKMSKGGLSFRDADAVHRAGTSKITHKKSVGGISQ